MPIVAGDEAGFASEADTRDLGIADLDRASGALAEARIRTAGVEEELPFDTSAEALRELRLLTLTTRFGDLDLTFEPSGTSGYPDLREHAVERELGSLRVAALADVIRSKEAAGRDKDVRGLVELHTLLRGQSRNAQ